MKKCLLLFVFVLCFFEGYRVGYEEAYDAKCLSLFVNKMNEKAVELGMLNTTFADPSGLLYENVGTVDDVMILLQACVNNKIIMSIWNKDSVIIPIYDNKGTERLVSMYNTFQSDSISPYKVLGRKTGSDGYIFNLAILIGNNVEEYSAYVILNASSEVERLTALRKLYDSSVVVNNRLSICCEFFGGGKYSLNSQYKIPLLSLTKLMTVLLALEYEPDLYREVIVKPCDIMRGSGIDIKAGECLTFYDALLAILISSSNTCSYAIGREVVDLYK